MNERQNLKNTLIREILYIPHSSFIIQHSEWDE